MSLLCEAYPDPSVAPMRASQMACVPSGVVGGLGTGRNDLHAIGVPCVGLAAMVEGRDQLAAAVVVPGLRVLINGMLCFGARFENSKARSPVARATRFRRCTSSTGASRVAAAAASHSFRTGRSPN